jgi:hypothetical protein
MSRRGHRGRRAEHAGSAPPSSSRGLPHVAQLSRLLRSGSACRCGAGADHHWSRTQAVDHGWRHQGQRRDRSEAPEPILRKVRTVRSERSDGDDRDPQVSGRSDQSVHGHEQIFDEHISRELLGDRDLKSPHDDRRDQLDDGDQGASRTRYGPKGRPMTSAQTRTVNTNRWPTGSGCSHGCCTRYGPAESAAISSEGGGGRITMSPPTYFETC